MKAENQHIAIIERKINTLVFRFFIVSPINTPYIMPANTVGYARVESINSGKQKAHRFTDAPFFNFKGCFHPTSYKIVFCKSRNSDPLQLQIWGKDKDYVKHNPFQSPIYNNIITKRVVNYFCLLLLKRNSNNALATKTTDAFFKKLKGHIVNSITIFLKNEEKYSKTQSACVSFGSSKVFR